MFVTRACPVAPQPTMPAVGCAWSQEHQGPLVLRGVAPSLHPSRVPLYTQAREERNASQFVMRDRTCQHAKEAPDPSTQKKKKSLSNLRFNLEHSKYAPCSNDMDGSKMITAPSTPQLACLGFCDVRQSATRRMNRAGNCLTFTSSPVFLIQTAGRSAVFAPSSPSSHV